MNPFLHGALMGLLVAIAGTAIGLNGARFWVFFASILLAIMAARLV